MGHSKRMEVNYTQFFLVSHLYATYASLLYVSWQVSNSKSNFSNQKKRYKPVK